MKQPILGVLTLMLVIIISLGIISLFEEATFSTWVAFLFMCCVPTQILFGLVWRCAVPVEIGRMSQPLKGICLLILTVLVGMIIAVLTYYLVGKGHGITPMLLMYTILSVVVTFWYAALWQCWPVSLWSKNPFVIGLSVLLVTYVGAYVLFSIFFDFSFLQGNPVYFADADPAGLFPAWTPLVFSVCTVAVMLSLILLEIWPVATISGTTTRVLLASCLVLILSFVLYYMAIIVVGIDQIKFMALVPVSYVFGTFLPLNLLQGTLMAELKQPMKGVLLIIVSIIAAIILQKIYLFAGPIVSGPLVSGPEGNYQEELWLASALLGVTFPVLVVMTDYFDFWPMKQVSADDATSSN